MVAVAARGWPVQRAATSSRAYLDGVLTVHMGDFQFSKHVSFPTDTTGQEKWFLPINIASKPTESSESSENGKVWGKGGFVYFRGIRVHNTVLEHHKSL